MGKTDVQRRYAKQFEMAEGFSFLLFLITVHENEL